MRKQTRRRKSSASQDQKRVLQLTHETVRALSSEELSQAAAGTDCPTGSHPTSLQDPGI